VAYGAPLFWKPMREMPLEEAAARALHLLVEDPALFLSLPVVLASNADELDGQVLVATARRLEVEAELGMVLTLTAELSGKATFQSWAEQCAKPHHGPPRYLVRRMSRFQVEGADRGAPRAAVAWGFRVDLPDSSFRQFFEKHYRRRG
jgi:hypothetical protein